MGFITVVSIFFVLNLFLMRWNKGRMSKTKFIIRTVGAFIVSAVVYRAVVAYMTASALTRAGLQGDTLGTVLGKMFVDGILAGILGLVIGGMILVISFLFRKLRGKS